MKKSLIALAVMAAAGAASAQSSVQLYGTADVFFGNVSQKDGAGNKVYGTDVGVGVNTGQTGIGSGGVDYSRIGFKGSEDLGGGLKAIFTLEKGFMVDSGTAAGGFDREASVGLAGSFGEVKLGKVWTAFDDQNDAASAVFASNALKPTAFVYRSGFRSPLLGGYNFNPDNGVRYTTNNLGGFTGAVSYAFGEDKTATLNASKTVALSGKYENGPLMLGAAYQKETSVGSLSSDKYVRLNAAYDFGVAKLLASYGQVKMDPTGDKTNEFQIGADVPLASNLVLSAGYAASKDKNGAGVETAKRNGLGLALAYVLSKRTIAYTGFNATKWENGAGATTAKVRALAVGVKHTF